MAEVRLEAARAAEVVAATPGLAAPALACGGSIGEFHPSLDGSGYPETPCNESSGGAVPVRTTCEGSFPGLFEMQGNVAEWVDSCTDSVGSDDLCMLMGGSWVTLVGGCQAVISDYSRSSRAPTFGFRCCSR